MIDYASLDRLSRKRVTDNYNGQKSMAKKRGIEWQFTKWTWLQWWGDDYHRRGQGRGKLCCARINDEGPYSPENCIKLTHEENSRQARIRYREGYRSNTRSVYIPFEQRRHLPRELYRARSIHTPYGDFPSLKAAMTALNITDHQLRCLRRDDPANYYLI